jgi:hypothetical protein
MGERMKEDTADIDITLNLIKPQVNPLPHLTMGKVPNGRMGRADGGKGEKICALRYR